MLPASFKYNTFNRMMEFLNESNRIEGIEKVDYLKDEFFRKADRGHFGAFVLSQQEALNREPLSVKKIRQWQALITREQISLGEHIEENEIGHIRSPSLRKNVRIGKHIPPSFDQVPTRLDYLVERINEALKHPEKMDDDAQFCKFLGSVFQEFESIHPFADGNGRTGRLLANYIATFCNRPIIVFDSEYAQRNIYYKAHDTPEAMILFMTKKIKEAIFGSDHQVLLKMNNNDDKTGIYLSPSGDRNESYEWHALDHEFAKRDISDVDEPAEIDSKLPRKIT